MRDHQISESKKYQVEELLSLLKSISAEERIKATEALINFGEEALPSLIQILNANNSLSSLNAAQILGRIGDPKAIVALTNAVRKKDNELSQVAAIALANIGEASLNSIIDLLNSEDPIIVAWSLRALGHLGSEKALPYLIQTSNSPNTLLRYWAVDALGKIKDNRAFDALVICLKDENVLVQCEAVWALSKLEDTRVVDTFIDLLESGKNADVRVAAINALGEIGGIKAIPQLMEVLQDDKTLTSSGIKVKEIALKTIKVLNDLS